MRLNQGRTTGEPSVSQPTAVPSASNGSARANRRDVTATAGRRRAAAPEEPNDEPAANVRTPLIVTATVTTTYRLAAVDPRLGGDSVALYLRAETETRVTVRVLRDNEIRGICSHTTERIRGIVGTRYLVRR